MSELQFYNRLLVVWFILALVVFFALLRWPAPYGRHSRAGWGPSVGTRTGWVVMEAPAVLWFLFWYLLGVGPNGVVPTVFFVMWQAHYVQRAFVYPFTLQSAQRRIPVVVVTMAVVFNTVNGYINGRFLFTFAPSYEAAWLADPRFVSGFALFVVGYIVNRRSDWLLRRRRLQNAGQYCRIDDGIFKYICCPNYLGEILIWSGWAVATWSLAGLSFAAWTIANLVPRARAHLHWCREYWSDYPEDRKAVIPGVW